MAVFAFKQGPSFCGVILVSEDSALGGRDAFVAFQIPRKPLDSHEQSQLVLGGGASETEATVPVF